MIRAVCPVICIVLVVSFIAGLPPSRLGRAAEPAEAPSQEAIEKIIREYILKHPEVIMESIQAHQQRQRAAEAERAKQAIIARQGELLNDPGSPVSGNPAGDITVVEFFDYRCPHCKTVAGTVKKLMEEDSKIRVVYKEFPILGEESLVAAKAALAAHAQGKYLPFHDALMGASEPLTLASVLKIAAKVGLDVKKLRADMEAPQIRATIEKNRALAQAIGVNGTPAFIIGDDLLPGATDLASLKQLVARARAK